jgi:hypothetical protein
MAVIAMFLAVLGTLAVPAAAAAAATSPRKGPVVLILVEGVDWRRAPKELDSFARASLSMHSAGSEFVDADGYLTVGKGRRAVSGKSLEDPASVPTANGDLVVPGWNDLVAHDKNRHYGGTLGAFGDALERSGANWTLISTDPQAALAVADHTGTVTHSVRGGAPELQSALNSGVDVIVANASSVEALAVMLHVTSDVCTIVASVSSPPLYVHLGVFAASPECGLGTGGLVSPSTKQPNFVELVDVAPTVLDRAGLEVPSGMVGKPVRAAGAVSTAGLRAENLRSHYAMKAHDGFTWFFIIAVSIGAVIALVRRRLPLAVSATLAALPLASFLMMWAPWWRGGALAGDIICAAIAIALGLAAAVVTRWRAHLCLGLVAAVTVVILVGDAVRGGTLEIDAPFGNSPTVAGRFEGIGNIAFGFSMGALLVVCALALRWDRRRAMPWVVIACAAFAVAGAPVLADKVGLVPVWVPAAGVLVISSATGRVRSRTLAIVVGVAVAILAAFAVFDLLRSTGSQSHLARFLTSGDLGDTIHRKATSMIRSFRTDPWRFVLPLPLLVVLREHRILRATPWLRSLSLALLTAAVLGSVLEDSGIAVGAAVVVASWTAVARFAVDQADSEVTAVEGAVDRPGPVAVR